jgi:hypothetical protein
MGQILSNDNDVHQQTSIFTKEYDMEKSSYSEDIHFTNNGRQRLRRNIYNEENQPRSEV